MSPRKRAILTLVLSAPVLTEIVSGNTPAHALLHPAVDLFLLGAYSLPLLVIREFALRRRLSLPGILLLGLAYGIWNEGLLAQTLLRLDHVPINTFSHYLYAAGFNFSWAAVIVPWHAFLAVLFPLALVGALYPRAANETWMSDRLFAVLAGVLGVAVVFLSLVRKPHPQMLACGAAIALLTAASSRLRRREENVSTKPASPRPAFAFGFVAYPAFIVTAILLAAHRVPAPVYFFVVMADLAVLAMIARRRCFLRPGAMAMLASGAYLAASLFNVLAGVLRHSPERIITGATLAVGFVILAQSGISKLTERAVAGSLF